MSEREQRVEDLFHRAAGLPPTEQTAFLQRECADDPTLQLKVEALLGADVGGTAPFLRSPFAAATAGGRIGPYRLIEQIGEGGMGVVYRAEQDEPIRRTVALKLVQPGSSPRDVASRFAAERQALAMMDHPHIATIFDAGTTDDGLPYFVMEFVRDARTLTDHADWRRLDTRARIALFVKVCDAVHHGHQKSILHRDLKPANILVDPDGQPKVIDFGIARSLDDETVLATQQTLAGQIVGTLPYLSPEQCAGAPVALDTRSDVYSLGVTLYQLLTGALPYALEGESILGAVEVIRDTAPTPPSRRIAALRGDVETIVMKALEKEPERRYASASELGLDLQRYLDGVPIQARPATFHYQLRLFARKYKIAASALAFALLASLIAAVVSTKFLFDARDAAAAERARTAEVMRLSAIQEIEALRERATELWPIAADLAAEYRTWLDTATRLIDELPEHRRILATIRARGRRVADDRWEYDSSEDAWWSAQLDKLIASLEDVADPDTGWITGTDPAFGWGVQRRLAWARRIEHETLSGPRAARSWAEAIAAIGDARQTPAYAGLAISPQIGLVPIGRDAASGLWEFGHPASGTVAGRGADGRLSVDADTGLVFVLIPGGTFAMGAQRHDESGANHDRLALDDEQPVREVTIDPFFLSKYEMTQGQWQRLTNSTPANYGADIPLVGPERWAQHPVERVTWNDAKRVLGCFRCDLPTEAQWEYAARAGTTTPFSTGAGRESLTGAANIADRTADRIGAPWMAIQDWPEFDDGYGLHAPVGRFRPNGFGLHDMHGNVNEWCRCHYAEYRFPLTPGTGAHRVPTVDHRVHRGGSYLRTAAEARCSARDGVTPATISNFIGVRPMRRIDGF